MNNVKIAVHTGTLNFRYLAAFLVEGLQSPANGPIVLYSNEAKDKKVSLTGHSHADWNHIDFVQTLGQRLLDSALGGVHFDPNDFTSYRSATDEDRVRRYGDKSAFLVVEASHVEDGARIGPIRQSDKRDFCLAWPDGFMDEVKARHKTFLDQSQAFLTFAMPSVSGFERVGSCIVADHPSGKPLYVLNASVSGRASVMKPIPADGPELFATLFRHSVGSEHFQTVFRLSAGSALNARDDLRAFLFAFIALEVFVGKFSDQYSTQLDRLTEKDHSPKIHAHLERLRKDEKENVLSYKFARVSSYLAVDNLDEIIDEFDRANRSRNDIVHGKLFDEAALPIAKVRNWLGELVRLRTAHLDAS